MAFLFLFCVHVTPNKYVLRMPVLSPDPDCRDFGDGKIHDMLLPCPVMDQQDLHTSRWRGGVMVSGTAHNLGKS